MMFPGEKEAIETVVALAERYGYGNLIDRLKTAWSEKLQRDHGFGARIADLSAGHICVWCNYDTRTGEKST